MQEDLQKIHQASMFLLEKCGIKILHEEIREIIKKKGIKVVDEIVYFTEDQLMSWVKKSPASFELFARNPQYNITLGGDRVEFAPGYGAPSIIESNGRVRSALMQDYVNFVKLFHQSPHHNINGGVLVQPTDLIQNQSRPIMAYLTLANSDKCLMAGTGEKAEVNAILEMMALAFGGKDEIIKKPRVMTIINMNSPLIIDTNMLENMKQYIEYGQPVIIASCAMAGSTGPVTLAGTLALSNAEILSGIAIAQIIREGTPVVYGNQTTTADMRTAGIAVGSPEGALCYAASARLAKEYNLPCRGGGAITDAKNVSVQSGYESMMTLMATAQEKTNLIIHSAGILDSYNAMSYEQFAVDVEIIGMVKKYLHGIKVSDETLALNAIEEIGIGGHFLAHPHTMEYCRQEPFLPDISLRGIITADPGEILSHKIHNKVEKMLEAFEQPSLPKELDQALVNFLIEHNYDPRPYIK
ncbi:MAG: trimethylamine methyltransferase family protein [Dehalobacterium sp.]|jgi:trimethylamine--corrinoid protein Co-methyltransferase